MKYCERCEGQVRVEYIWTASSINQMCDNVIRGINGEDQLPVDPPHGEIRRCECQAVLVSK